MARWSQEIAFYGQHIPERDSSSGMAISPFTLMLSNSLMMIHVLDHQHIAILYILALLIQTKIEVNFSLRASAATLSLITINI